MRSPNEQEGLHGRFDENPGVSLSRRFLFAFYGLLAGDTALFLLLFLLFPGIARAPEVLVVYALVFCRLGDYRAACRTGGPAALSVPLICAGAIADRGGAWADSITCNLSHARGNKRGAQNVPSRQQRNFLCDVYAGFHDVVYRLYSFTAQAGCVAIRTQYETL